MSGELNRRMITLSIMAATVMQTLDSTIANVALPHMQGALSASQDQIAWVLTAYIVAAAIATPLTGWMVDRFGQKRVFLASVIGFTVASALCGLAESLGQIVAARLLQGVFGAALVPMSQMVLMEINPPAKQGSGHGGVGHGRDGRAHPRARRSAAGSPTATTGAGCSSSTSRWARSRPTASGAISTRAPRHGVMRFDLFGFAALSLAVGALQLLLDRGRAERLVLLHRDLDRGRRDGRGVQLFHRAYRAHAAADNHSSIIGCSRTAITSPASRSFSSSAW